MSQLKVIREVYRKNICGNSKICENCSQRASLDIYSVGRDTPNFSACTIFICKKLKKYKESDKININNGRKNYV